MPRHTQISHLHLRRNRFRELDHSVVKKYQLAVRRGDKFPPIEVIDYYGKLWIHEGYHRYYTHKREGRKTIFARTIVRYR